MTFSHTSSLTRVKTMQEEPVHLLKKPWAFVSKNVGKT